MKLKDMYGDKKTGKILFEAGILIMIVNLLSAIGIWQSISNDWKVVGEGRLFFQAFIQSGGKYAITYLNQEGIYISFLSVLFSFLGNKEELVSIINLILQLAGIGFFYLGAKKLFHFVFPLAVAVISGLLSGCFYPVIMDSPMHIIWFLSGFLFWIIAKILKDISSRPLTGLTSNLSKVILPGILLGVFCYIDLAGCFLLVTTILFMLLIDKSSRKEKGSRFFYFLLSYLSGFFVMFCLWNDFVFNTTVFHQWFYDKTRHLKQDTILDQYISLAIILAVCIVFYIIKYFRKIAPAATTELDAVFQQIVGQEEQMYTERNQAAEEQMYTERNQAAEEQMYTEGNQTAEEQMGIKVEPEIKKPIKLIENPLPLPKKHVRKEMNYAFEPTKDQMHYDLNNYRLDDDYDLKD